MNLIHKLQKRVAEQGAEIEALRSGLVDIKRYLQSNKFSADNSVQANDVLLRIREIENAANDAPNGVNFQPSPGKRRIKTNVWDNTKGYLGSKRVADFGTDDIAASDWIALHNGDEVVYRKSHRWAGFIFDKAELELTQKLDK
jgi:hypothetical protein